MNDAFGVRCRQPGSEDLTRWALQVVDDLVRIQREGGSTSWCDEVERRRGDVRALLIRHEIPDGPRLGEELEDPAEPPLPAPFSPATMRSLAAVPGTESEIPCRP